MAGRRNPLGSHNTSGDLPQGVADAWCCFGVLLGALVLSILGKLGDVRDLRE